MSEELLEIEPPPLEPPEQLQKLKSKIKRRRLPSPFAPKFTTSMRIPEPLSVSEYKKLLSITSTRIAYFSFEEAIPILLDKRKTLDLFWSKDSCCLEASTAFARSLGFKSAPEVIGKSFATLLPPNDTNFRLIERWIDSGFGNRQFETVETNQGEDSLVCSTSLYGEIKANLLKGLWIISKDITEIVVTRKQAKEIEAHYHALLEKSDVFLLQTNTEGRIVHISSHIFGLTGYSHTDFLKSPALYHHLIHPEDRFEYLRLFQNQLLGENKKRFFEYRLKLKDNTYQWFQERRLCKLNREGKTEHVDSLVWNVHKRKQLSLGMIHAQKLETIGLLAGGIAHDVNNHLTAILGQISLSLEDLGKNHPLEDRLMAAKQAAIQCANITKSLLRLSRKEEIEFELLDPANLLRASYLLISHLLPTTIDVKISLDSPLPMLKGNFSQLQQVILNLAINAKDAMPSGGVLHLKAKQYQHIEGQERFFEARTGSYVLLTIADTGKGIPKNQIEHIFDPFFSSKPAGRGTGLGLSTVKTILKAHQGSISVSNVLNKGSKFEVIIPASARMQKADKGLNALCSKTPSQAKPKLSLENLSILVAEDDPLVLDMICSALTMNNCQVIISRSGPEALKIIESSLDDLDLLLVDYTMPGFTGEELINKIPVQSSIPIILTSGNYRVQKKIDAFDRKVNFLKKPFMISELINLIYQLTRKQ